MNGQGKWVRTTLIGIGVAVVHFVASFMSMMSNLYGALGEITAVGRVFASLFDVLWFPLTLVMAGWENFPGLFALSNEATAALVGGNSLLWGATLALLWRWWRVRRAGRKRTVEDVWQDL